MQIRRILTLLTIGLSILCFSCSATTGGDESDPNAGKTEIDYEVFVTHLLTEDSNIFTKNNVIVTAIYDDGTTQTVTDFTIEPASFEVTVGNGTEFTFKRGNDIRTFKAFKANQNTTDNIIKDGSVYKFGDFAKTKLTSTSGIVFSDNIARNGWYIGSDGNYYGKVGTDYYKVEPIEWDLYTDNYNGKKLLVTHNIIYGGLLYSESTQDRIIQGKTVYSNNYEYSNLRAFLNGKTLYLDDGTTSDKYKVSNFLNMAFTDSAKNKILTTTVKNDGNSSNDPTNTGWSRIDGTKNNDENGNPLNEPTNKTPYTCSDTQDKVFALSVFDCTNTIYGVASGCEGNSPNLNRRVTEFSDALGVYNESDIGYYMIRTPYYKQADMIRYVKIGHCYQSILLSDSTLGVVPAIVVNTLPE